MLTLTTTETIPSILSFFEEVNGFKPTQDQSELLTDLVDLINPTLNKLVVSSARQTGKSLCVATATLYLSIYYTISILLTSAQKNNVYAHILTIMEKNKELWKYMKSEGRIGIIPITGYTTTSGSIVHLRGCTEISVIGVFCTYLIVDETEMYPRNTLDAATGCLSGLAKRVFIGTPSDPRNPTYFNELIKDHKKLGYKLYHWSQRQCTWQTPEFIRDKERQFKRTPWRIKAEIEGELPSLKEVGEFTIEDIESAFQPVTNHPMSKGVIDIRLGVDTGYGKPSKFALCITERVTSVKKKILYVEQHSEVDWDKILEVVDAAPIIICDYRPAFFREKLQELRPDKLYYWLDSTGKKDRIIGQLSDLLMSHGLIIPNEYRELLYEPLCKYRKGMRSGDDLIDALSYSIYEDDILANMIAAYKEKQTQKNKSGRVGGLKDQYGRPCVFKYRKGDDTHDR